MMIPRIVWASWRSAKTGSSSSPQTIGSHTLGGIASGPTTMEEAIEFGELHAVRRRVVGGEEIVERREIDGAVERDGSKHDACLRSRAGRQYRTRRASRVRFEALGPVI